MAVCSWQLAVEMRREGGGKTWETAFLGKEWGNWVRFAGRDRWRLEKDRVREIQGMGAEIGDAWGREWVRFVGGAMAWDALAWLSVIVSPPSMCNVALVG